MRKAIAEYAIVYTIGAIGYGIMEIVWRGYTHWSMTITGGLCLMLIYFTNASRNQWGLFKKCLICALLITSVEFMVGCVVNIMLGWQVWDYSNMPFSLMGQVCLGFCALWMLLCLPMLLFSELLQKKIFGYRH